MKKKIRETVMIMQCCVFIYFHQKKSYLCSMDIVGRREPYKNLLLRSQKEDGGRAFSTPNQLISFYTWVIYLTELQKLGFVQALSVTASGTLGHGFLCHSE